MKKRALTKDAFGRLLMRLGFKCYQDYLSSPLWRSIRLRKLSRHPRCFFCRRSASQVHHIGYTQANLTGRSLRGLSSLCGFCHEEVEFEAGRKLSLPEAQAKFKRMSRARTKGRVRRAEMVAERIAVRENRALSREFYAIVRG